MTRNAQVMEVRLFLEDICCDLCRFQHVTEDGVAPDAVRIRQEVDLGIPGAFADIQVRVPGAKPYFVEVKWGYDAEQIVEHVARKYGVLTPISQQAAKVILIADTSAHPEWLSVEAQLRTCINPKLGLEVWGLDTFSKLIEARFGVGLQEFNETNLRKVRVAIDQLKGRYAFGDAYIDSTLQSYLTWHLDFSTLSRLQETHRSSAETILPPGLYRDVAVVIADLTAFSCYVRDTPDDSVVRSVLTSFYTKARRQVHNSRGMLSQFVGDGVIAIFGVPDSSSDYAEDALDCATALIDIGSSISNEWQRRIDRCQNTGGCHVGVALGDLHVVPLRAFSRAHMGVIADVVNIAARLSNAAMAREIVVSNGFFQRLSKASQKQFREMEPIEAKNVGRLRAWKHGTG